MKRIIERVCVRTCEEADLKALRILPLRDDAGKCGS